MTKLTQQKAESVVDHLLLGIADLDQGIDWVRSTTGVEALKSGSHPGAGTRNALLSLGIRQYMEIIAIDPQQTETSRTADLIRQLRAPQLITWAAATNDIVSMAEMARQAGCGIEGPIDGSRVKPDGHTLRWKTLRILSECGDVIPFFIQWDTGIVHPSEDSPSGCRLVTLEIRHPKADRLQEILASLGIVATIHSGTTPKLETVIDTPAGIVRIS